MNAHPTALAVAVALACAAATCAPAHAAVTLADISFWVGPADGPGINQAVLVLDFGFPGAPTGAPSLAWGYRWSATDTRTGLDMLAAVVAADTRVTVSGLEFGFVDTIGYDLDLDGTIDYAHPGFDPGTGRYSVYWVNNAVVEGTPPLFADAGHILPPNGNPYAAEAPGMWVLSTTGMAGRPLADGSWDGWVYASDPAAAPREPSAARVPEPTSAALLLAAACLWQRRRDARESGHLESRASIHHPAPAVLDPARPSCPHP